MIKYYFIFFMIFICLLSHFSCLENGSSLVDAIKETVNNTQETTIDTLEAEFISKVTIYLKNQENVKLKGFKAYWQFGYENSSSNASGEFLQEAITEYQNIIDYCEIIHSCIVEDLEPLQHSTDFSLHPFHLRP